MHACIIAGSLAAAGAARPETAEPPQRASVRSVVKAGPRGQLVRRLAVVRPAGKSQAEALSELGLAPEIIDAVVARLAAQHEIDPLLVRAVIQVESNYDPFAVSPKGAQGLMQLMPATARTLDVANAFRPVENIEAGVRHLKALLVKFGGQVGPALAAYNAGAGAVIKYGGVPPYRETTEYVAKVGRKWTEARNAAAESSKSEQTKNAEAHPQLEVWRDAAGVLHIRTRTIQ